jgi:bacillolysin
VKQERKKLSRPCTFGLSNFVCAFSSLALDEAMSDLFGALVDRETGTTGDDIWLMGEDVLTPGILGDTVRNMKNPR